MQLIFDLLSWFAKPVVKVFISVGSIISFLLGALAAPQSWMNAVICTCIDVIASILPSTPDTLKIGYLIDQLATSMPVVGRGIIMDLFSTASLIFGLSVAIKIYKLIPFKAS